jgi:hypothetical protein
MVGEEEEVLLVLVATADAVFVKVWVEMVVITTIDASSIINTGPDDIIIFNWFYKYSKIWLTMFNYLNKGVKFLHILLSDFTSCVIVMYLHKSSNREGKELQSL